MKKVLGIAAALAASLSFVPAASADERTCRGSLGAITVDNLRVPRRRARARWSVRASRARSRSSGAPR